MISQINVYNIKCKFDLIKLVTINALHILIVKINFGEFISISNNNPMIMLSIWLAIMLQKWSQKTIITNNRQHQIITMEKLQIGMHIIIIKYSNPMRNLDKI